MQRPIIIGAGIAGLTLGVALRQLGIEAEIYESAPKIEPIGAGIWVAPNAMQIFDRLGLAAKIAASGAEVQRVSITRADLRVITSAAQAEVKRKFGFPIVAIQRAELHRILLDSFGDRNLHLGKRLRAIERNSDLPKAMFDDGGSAEASLLIGADGIHSEVRRELFGNLPMRRTGQTCWRGLADFDLPAHFQNNTTEMWGRTSRMGIADVGHGKAYWFLVQSGVNHGAQISKPELLKIVQGYTEAAADLIEATSMSAITEVELEDLPLRLPWFSGKVCLIGDAAHPMTPNLGQGGAQAVEDAYTLARLLSQHSDPGDAFQDFQTRRFAKVKSIVNTSYQLGSFIHSGWPRLRNFLFRAMPSRLGERGMERIYSNSIADSV